MKKTILFLFAIAFLLPDGMCQLWKLRRLELIVAPGATHLFGDMGNRTSGESGVGNGLTLSQTGLNLNAGVRYFLLREVAARASLTAGSFRSSDAGGSRGYESSTAFFESALLGEYYIIKNKAEDNYLFLKQKRHQAFPAISYMDLYVFAGFGGILYDAKPNAKLFQIATERSGFAPVIPAGFGLRFNPSGNAAIGVEAGGRYTFSDEIDGFAPAGSGGNDVYYFLNFTLAWKIWVRRFPRF